MSLTNQIHIYSVDTSCFYEAEEQALHNRLSRLYKLRKREGLKKKYKSALNRQIKRTKEKLSEYLDNRLQNSTPRELRPSAICSKNVISLFESSLTRAMGVKTNTLTEDLMIVNVFFFQVFEGLVRDGFYYNGERYIFLTASAGQIRTKKCQMIKESTYERIQQKIMCGLTVRDINDAGGMNTNKFCSYLALCGSATEPWEDFDIDKSIVVDDFETDVEGYVDFIDDKTYEITREWRKVKIPHMDGCGISLDGPTKMCRLPWVKGLLVQFPFDEFIREKCPDGRCIVTDIYGDEHDILAEGIRYIFTKSQFKLYKFYSSWNEYKEKFKKYGCEASYCNEEEEYIKKSKINYQMLQTLSDMTDGEINRLTKKTIEDIEKIGNDYQTTMRLLGATDYNKNKSYFQEALMIYPELFRDPYSKDVLKQTKKSLVKQAKAGRLRVNGEYLFVCPDLYAFCEWLFLGEINPVGLLKENQVYTKEFEDNVKLACLRSPHLYKEWAVKANTRDKEKEKWFRKSKCIYVSIHTLLSRILQFD